MRRLRIFISSLGDVQKEGQIAERVVGRLTAEFADHVALDPYFWEYEPMRITADFQAKVDPPSDFDIVVCILCVATGNTAACTRRPALSIGHRVRSEHRNCVLPPARLARRVGLSQPDSGADQAVAEGGARTGLSAARS